MAAGGLDTRSLARLNLNDSSLPGSFEFSSGQYEVNEGVGALVVTVRRTGGTLGSTTVRYETRDETAVAPADFTARSAL